MPCQTNVVTHFFVRMLPSASRFCISSGIRRWEHESFVRWACNFLGNEHKKFEKRERNQPMTRERIRYWFDAEKCNGTRRTDSNAQLGNPPAQHRRFVLDHGCTEEALRPWQVNNRNRWPMPFTLKNRQTQPRFYITNYASNLKELLCGHSASDFLSNPSPSCTHVHGIPTKGMYDHLY